MIDSLVKIIDKVVTLLKEKELRSKEFFITNIENIYVEIREVHDDYINMLEELRQRLKRSSYKESISFLQSEKNRLEALRIKIFSISKSGVSNNNIAVEYREFFRRCLNYFGLASGEFLFDYSTYNCKYLGVYSSLIEGLNEVENKGDEQFNKKRGTKYELDISLYVLRKNLATEFEKISETYAQLRLSL